MFSGTRHPLPAYPPAGLGIPAADPPFSLPYTNVIVAVTPCCILEPFWPEFIRHFAKA